MLLLPMIALKHDQIRPIRGVMKSVGGGWWDLAGLKDVVCGWS